MGNADLVTVIGWLALACIAGALIGLFPVPGCDHAECRAMHRRNEERDRERRERGDRA